MTIGTVIFLLATAIVLFMARTVIMRFLKDNLFTSVNVAIRNITRKDYENNR